MKQKILHIIYRFLKFCAQKYIKKHNPKVIGITGSVGKTSARMIIAQVLKQVQWEKVVSTSPKNFNSELGIIFSIFEITQYSPSISSLWKNIWIILKKLFFSKKPYDILVLEYGIDAPGDMKYLTSVVTPDYWVFTKLDFVHAEFFDTKEEIWEEKRILLDTSKEKIYVWNFDEYLKKIFDEYLQKKQFFPHIENSDFSQKDGKIFSEFLFENKKIRANIFGQENLDYIALALQIARDMGIELLQDEYVFNLENQPGRFNILEWIKWNILIDSSYNAAPASMVKMIENTFALQKNLFSDYKVFLVLGDMRELWEISAGKHLQLNDSVIFADGIYCIGTEILPLYQAIEMQWFEWEKNIFTKANTAWESLKKFLENTDEKYVILFKWSQNTIFTEEVLKAVLENKDDEKNLVRQSQDWIEKKEKFFKS